MSPLWSFNLRFFDLIYFFVSPHFDHNALMHQVLYVLNAPVWIRHCIDYKPTSMEGLHRWKESFEWMDAWTKERKKEWMNDWCYHKTSVPFFYRKSAFKSSSKHFKFRSRIAKTKDPVIMRDGPCPCNVGLYRPTVLWTVPSGALWTKHWPINYRNNYLWDGLIMWSYI